MQNNIFRIFLLLILATLASCASVKKEYLLSHIKEIQNLEKQDHKFCTSLNLELNKTDNFKSRLYWRCRLSMAKYKIKTNPVSRIDIKRNLDINELISKISFKIAETPEASLLKESKKMDNIHHLKCSRMGFIIDFTNAEKTDDYFACRKALVDEQQVFPPFGNAEYLKYPNNSYTIGLVIDIRIDKAIKEYQAAEKEHPACIKYYSNKQKFTECGNAQNEAKKCFLEIDKKRFQKELDKKIICQKRSFLQFPDSLLKEDVSKKNDSKINSKVNSYDQNSFAALGLDEESFAGKKKVDKVKKEESSAKLNSKNNLYSKFELTKLRQEYISECQQEADDQIKQYNDSLVDSCKAMEVYE